MALTLNNPVLFNAAFSAALAGQLAGNALTGVPATDNTAGNYAVACNIAVAFATEVDSLVPQGAPAAIANVSSAHASLPPTTAAITATQSAYVSAMYGLCFAYWFQRKSANLVGTDLGATPADYAIPAAAIAGQFAEVVATLTAGAVGSLV